MFFTSAMSVLNKKEEGSKDDDEEVDVFSKSREVEIAKSFSMETAVRYVYGQGFGIDVRVLTDEEKEANERARYCRQELLKLKARRATVEAGEADTYQIMQQEDIERWLADIELRIMEQSRQLGIKPSELPIWIAPLMAGKRKVGNVASAASAAAAAIRMKLRTNGLAAKRDLKSTSGTSTPSDDKSAAIAALTDLMEELEELGISARESEAEEEKQGPKRNVRFLTPRSSPFPTPGPSPFQTPRSSPFSSPRPSPFVTPRSSPSVENIGILRNAGSKKTDSSVAVESGVPESTQEKIKSEKSKLKKTKKSKVSALAVSATLRPSSSPSQSTSTGNSSTPTVGHPAVLSKSSKKGYVTRRRGSENSPLAPPYPS